MQIQWKKEIGNRRRRELKWKCRKRCQRKYERENIWKKIEVDRHVDSRGCPLEWSHLWCSGTFQTFQVLLLGSIKVVVGVIG